MLRTFTAVALALAALTASPPVLAQPAAQPPAHATTAHVDRARLFDTVVDRINKRFWDADFLKRERFGELATSARPGVLDAPSDAAAVARINALIDQMRASHFRLHSPDELGYYILLDLSPGAAGAQDLIGRQFWGSRPHYAGTGAFTAEIDGRHIIDGIMDGSPAERAGLKIGDEIVDVDGAPYHLIRSFRGKLGGTARLGIRRTAQGPIEPVNVAVLPIVPGLAFDQATQASARVIQHNGKRIGYFRIWALFSDEPMILAMARLSPAGRLLRIERGSEGRSVSTTTFASRLGQLTQQPLDGMIVDLRGKVGGQDFSETLIGLLDGRWQTQLQGAPYLHRTIGRNQNQNARRVEAHNPSFRSKTVLLIDHHTRSAGEMISHSFRYARMGEIVGTTTAGHVLAGGIEVMPGDYILQVPQSRPEIDGQYLEGKGVAPDSVVERPLPYSGGADPVLDAGLKRLGEMLAR